jgi:lysophospholipase L1-like esterase
MRRTATVLAAVALATIAAVLPAVPAAAAAPVATSPYVALGDSYSSAAGVKPQVAGTPSACRRSMLDYSHVIATRTRPKFKDRTCSGARTRDFFGPQSAGVAPQLDAVTKDTRLVTMTIGANDEGVFGSITSGCIAASLASGSISGNPCERTFGSTFTDEITQQTYPNLVKALTAVRAKAPAATVVVLGYPRILPDTGRASCYAAMPVSTGDVAYVTHVETVLNATIRKAAQRTGARFVDMWPSSKGHDSCQPAGTRWIEPFNGAVNAARVHPNAAGEAAMARATLTALGL